MSKNTLIIIAAVIVAALGFWFLRGDTPETGGDGSASMLAPALLILNEQNSSGITGTVAFAEEGASTRVVVALEGASDDGVQPIHIHEGACPNPGAVRYPLTSASGGLSETVLNVPLSELMGGLPLAVNAHKSADEASTYVACGDITPDLLLGANEMVVDEEVMVDDEEVVEE